MDKLKTIFKTVLSFFAICLVLITAKDGNSEFQLEMESSPRIIDVEKFGVNGKDTEDDTAGFNLAVKKAEDGDVLRVPEGKYWINAVSKERPYYNDTGGILIDGKDNIKIELAPDAEIIAIPNSSPGYAVVNIKNSRNITLNGGKITGDRLNHGGLSGEWGYGLQIRNSRNVQIVGTEINECWGDGIFLGRTTENSVNHNISVSGVVLSNNRRQGISVLNACGLRVTNCTVSGTNGTDPQAGIDIEPNTFDTIAYVSIIGNTFLDNAGFGITIGGRTSYGGVTISDNTIQGSPCGINIHPNINFPAFLQDITISNNTIILPVTYSKSICGISLYRISESVINDNSVSKEASQLQASSREYGMYIDDYVFANHMEGNVIRNTYWGVYYKKYPVGVQKVELSKNEFSGNTVIAPVRANLQSNEE